MAVTVEIEFQGKKARGRGEDARSAAYIAARKVNFSNHHAEIHPAGPGMYKYTNGYGLIATVVEIAKKGRK